MRGTVEDRVVRGEEEFLEIIFFILPSLQSHVLFYVLLSTPDFIKEIVVHL